MKFVALALAVIGGLAVAAPASAEGCPWKDKKAENPPTVGS